MKVWKFELKSGLPIAMPEGATALSVGAQGVGLFVWALVDPEAPLTDRWFEVHGTGHEIRPWLLGRFVGTAFMESSMGPFVWHVWEQA